MKKKIRIIPAIDLIDGKCVRLQQGDYSLKTIYNENPLEVAKMFEDAGIKYLHLVDLDGAKARKVVNWKVIEEITNQTQLKVDFGGGVKTTETFKDLINAGVYKVNIGSLAVAEPQLFSSWIQQFGDAVILSADVKEEKIAINGWEKDSELDIYDMLEQYTSKGLRQVVCTDISMDGMLKGPSIALYEKIMDQFPNLKLVASGGVANIEDVEILDEMELDGVIIGKALYENRISLKQLEAYVD